jgi:nucleotide-binding universal stress UspA family protein
MMPYLAHVFKEKKARRKPRREESMIKNILVSIGGMPHEKNAFEYAGHLAVLLEAHLSCVFFQDGEQSGQESIANRVASEIESEGAEYDFLDYHVEMVAGRPTETIVQKARTADLVVIGIPESVKRDGRRLIHDRIDDILLRITKPTIVVHEQCTFLKRILAVYRDDRFSDHVLELATELSERTRADLLGLALAETQIQAAQNTQQMKDYLRFHNVNADFMTLRGFTVANILETATGQNCDLIALSASHHSRLYERLFQSTTETVVKLANRAVMVAR